MAQAVAQEPEDGFQTHSASPLQESAVAYAEEQLLMHFGVTTTPFVLAAVAHKQRDEAEQLPASTYWAQFSRQVRLSSSHVH